MATNTALNRIGNDLPAAIPNPNTGQPNCVYWQRLASCSTVLARQKIPFSIAYRLGVLPLGLVRDATDKEVLIVCFSEPFSMQCYQEVRFLAQVDLVAETAPREIVQRAIHKAYLGGVDQLRTVINCANKIVSEQRIGLSPSNAEGLHQQIPELLETLLNHAVSISASDLHLEPQLEGSCARFRVDGLLRTEPVERVSRYVAQCLSRRIKVLARLDPTEEALPQEGGFTFLAGDRQVRLRVSTIPTLDGEKIVLRLLQDDFLSSAITSDTFIAALSTFGMNDQQKQCFASCLTLRHGTLLLSGPTGSGKSTLLYAALHYLNREVSNVMSIEDPVERRIAGVNQVQVSPSKGLNYQQLLPYVLRQDPDVLMIGEIRDCQTAEVALTAGITGHLVLSTIHAGSCLEVLHRLTQLQVDAELVALSLRLISAQRLIPKNCRECLSSIRATTRIAALFRIRTDTELFVSVGCDSCQHRAVSGRLGVYEFLPMGEDIRQVLLQRSRNASDPHHHMVHQLKIAAQGLGYRPLAYAVRDALLQGTISPQAALSALGLAGERLAP